MRRTLTGCLFAVAAREAEGLSVSKEHLAHISPLGWAHILLTGEYR
jgi:hypothetical protein